MYISTLPWIFNMVLVATIILLAGEIVVARKDERDTHSRMLELFGESDKERKKKRLLKQKIWGPRATKSINSSKGPLREDANLSPDMEVAASSTENLDKGEDSVGSKDMTALTACVERWVKNREIDKAHPRMQLIKLAEEFGEISEGLAEKDKQSVADGVGYTYVTLVALCTALDLEINECVYHAYKEIENRKGEMVDGVFIKEEDL